MNILEKEKITSAEFPQILDNIYHMDCLDFLKKLPDNCLDIVVTSPPYNLQNQNRSENPKVFRKPFDPTKKNDRDNNLITNSGYDSGGECLPHSVYVRQQRTLINQVLRCLKPHGAFFYNTKWRMYNGLLDMRTDITEEFPIRQVIIWNRYATFARNSVSFMPVYEVIYFFVKGSTEDGACCHLKNEGINLTDVWEILPEREKKDHPAPYPLQLAYNCVMSVENKNNEPFVVYDPYMGTGTSAVAALSMGYHYIGTDISENYINMAKTRIERNKINPEHILLNSKSEQAKQFKRFDNAKETIGVKKIFD